MSAPAPDWIAVDWGSSTLRVWAMAQDGTVLDARSSAQGTGTLSPDRFEPALLTLLDGLARPHTALPVVCCGMVGSREGWAEAPYAPTPCAPPSIGQATRAAPHDSRLAVHILPGVRQDSPADVMRGEETQIAGYLAGDPQFDGVLCLPGTHTKWVHISAGEIFSFRTFMTGELYALLAGSSVLRHGIGTETDDTAFASAVADAMSRPQSFAADLFSLRAAHLLHDLPGAQAAARLSGLLIGLELAGARPYWLGRDIRVIGAGRVVDAYVAALSEQGVAARRESGDAMVLRGLTAAYDTLKGKSA